MRKLFSLFICTLLMISVIISTGLEGLKSNNHYNAFISFDIPDYEEPDANLPASHSFASEVSPVHYSFLATYTEKLQVSTNLIRAPPFS